MVEKKNKVNRPARIAKRNKQSYAQYVWVRDIYNHLDDINSKLKTLNECIEELNKRIIDTEKRITIVENAIFIRKEDNNNIKGEQSE
jgi:peptidoglycan hydrolase CwlO-like protein